MPMLMERKKEIKTKRRGKENNCDSFVARSGGD
jgi:hypothetical protein